MEKGFLDFFPYFTRADPSFIHCDASLAEYPGSRFPLLTEMPPFKVGTQNYETNLTKPYAIHGRPLFGFFWFHR